MTEENIVTFSDNSGTYLADILLDQKIITKVKNNGELDIEKTEGTKTKFLDFLKRENIVYYGIMQGEQAVCIEQANNRFQVPLVRIEDLQKRIGKIKKEHKEKIGYIHINTVQIVLKAAFREGISTPIELIVEDNRIINQQEKILGTIDGDLGYGIIKFCVSPQYPIPLQTKTIQNCISITCNFKRQDLMKQGDIPFIACYRIAYALSNSSVSMTYKHKEKLYTDELFNRTSTIIKEDKIGLDFLRTRSQRIDQPLRLKFEQARPSISSLVPRIEPPMQKVDPYKQNSDKELGDKISALSNQITEINRKL